MLTDDDVAKIADTVHSWKTGEGYEDVAGFCKSASLDEIEKNGFVLTPGRYVGFEDSTESDEDFMEKFQKLSTDLKALAEESSTLQAEIDRNLSHLSEN